jgi:hypothetical protein
MKRNIKSLDAIAVEINQLTAAKASGVIVSGLCRTCFASEDLKSNVLRVWRTVLPDLREIEGGRA